MKKNMILRNRIEQVRKQKRMSQQYLAKKVGVVQNTCIEKCKYEPFSVFGVLVM